MTGRIQIFPVAGAVPDVGFHHVRRFANTRAQRPRRPQIALIVAAGARKGT